MRYPRGRTAWIALAALLAPAGLRAQSVTPLVGAAYEHYRFDEPDAFGVSSLSLLTIPFSGMIDLNSRVSLRVAGAYARARVVQSIASRIRRSETLSGPTDTEASVTLDLGRGMATITAVTVLPTGHDALTSSEVLTAGVIAEDLLPFRVSSLGSGGGAGVQATLGGRGMRCCALGGFAWGISVGYLAPHTFQPLANDTIEYSPGDQFEINAIVERAIGATGTATLQLGWQRFGPDRRDTIDAFARIFQTGNRFRAMIMYDFAIDRTHAILYGGVFSRGEGAFTNSVRRWPAQRLFFAGAATHIPLGELMLQPMADLRLQDMQGARRTGFLLDVGASLEVPFGGSTWIPTARARLGRVETSDMESAFRGVELGFLVRLGRWGR